MDEEDLAQMKEDRVLENTETFKSDRLGSMKDDLADRKYVQLFCSLLSSSPSFPILTRGIVERQS